MESKMLTVEELAERLRIGTTSAYKLCNRPDFPAVRVGGLIRIPASDLEEWIEEQKSTAAGERGRHAGSNAG